MARNLRSIAVDRLDVAILRHLYGPVATPTGLPTAWSIARRIGAHGATVQRRLARLRETGVLRGVRVAPGAATLRAKAQLVEFEYAEGAAKTQAMRQLAAAQNVFEVHDLVGAEVCAWVYAFDDENPERATRTLERVTGATRATVLQAWTNGGDAAPGALDLRILRALAPDGHVPMNALASAAGATPKTIRARLRALARAQAFVTYPSVSFDHLAGAIPFVLRADLAGGRGREGHAALLGAFPDHVCASLPRGRAAFLWLVAATTGEIGRALDAAHALPGVERARYQLVRALHGYPEKVQARIDALVARGLKPGSQAHASGSRRARPGARASAGGRKGSPPPRRSRAAR